MRSAGLDQAEMGRVRTTARYCKHLQAYASIQDHSRICTQHHAAIRSRSQQHAAATVVQIETVCMSLSCAEEFLPALAAARVAGLKRKGLQATLAALVRSGGVVFGIFDSFWLPHAPSILQRISAP